MAFAGDLYCVMVLRSLVARGVKVMRVNSRVVRFWSGLTCLSNQGEELAVRFEVEKRENHYHSTGYLGTVPTAPVSIMPLFNRNPLYHDLYSNQGYRHHCTPNPRPIPQLLTSSVCMQQQHRPGVTVTSMRKPEIQPLAPLDRAVLDVGGPLRLALAPPDSLLLLVAPDIVRLGQQEDADGRDVDGDQRRVAVPVQRLVRVDVDEAVAHPAELDRHLRVGVSVVVGGSRGGKVEGKLTL